MFSMRMFCSFVIATVTAGCSGAPDEGAQSSEGEQVIGEVSQALTSSELLVAFRTSDNVHYLTAEGDGGGTVSANRTEIGPWERFIIYDINGDSLVSGDRVQIRHVNAAGSSWWLTADVNGGGPGSILRANRTVPLSWETFVISTPGGGGIGGGSQINLRAANPYYVSAQVGGGVSGDGSVVVDRPVAGPWETFTLVAITPSSLCPFSNTLCLFDQANFGGQRLTVGSVGPSGTCVNLVELGWGGRARSAVKTGPFYARANSDQGCLSRLYIEFTAFEPTLPFQPNSVFVF